MLAKSLLKSLIAFVLLLGAAGRADAQSPSDAEDLNWAEKMFSELRIDFGDIARGSDARRRIEIKNIYQETVRITNVRTTCGCTAVEPNRQVLETHEVAEVEVTMNTVKFMRRKDSNVDITLTYDGGRPLTVRVPVTAYIRPDVVVEPGTVEFGTVQVGEGAERSVRIAFADDDDAWRDWRIMDVGSQNESVSTVLEETSRSGGQVSYNLSVTLSPQAPAGTIHDLILLTTNDERSPQVPVTVRGEVVPDIIVNPETLVLGELTPGVTKTMSVVVRGRRPFAIEKIECESDRDCFRVRLNEQVRSVHVLPLTVIPPDEPGEFRERFYLTISGREEPVTFSAEGVILPSGRETAAAR